MMDDNNLVDDYVSRAETNGDIETWIQENICKWKSSFDEFSVYAPNNKDYHHFYVYTQLYKILSDITLAKTSVCLNHLRRLNIYDKTNLEYFVIYMLDAVCDNPSCGLAYARLCEEMLHECEEPEQQVKLLKTLDKNCKTYFSKNTFKYSTRCLKIMEIKLCKKFFLKLRLIE
ncbi:hypothetical protein FQR65_LT15655 [Abscondita terminalis]|nr:hypothetical protein FQR65_LT15655 [Abscondita terminalis]